ncbi:HNH endonuclease [Microbacterium sp. cf046]|nr:HNH endonuclease [Microbacterium sp. cf046]
MLRSLIDGLVRTEAQIGALQAHQAMLYTAVTEVVELQTSRLQGAARRDREMPLREVTAEVAAALRVTERTVQRRMSDAATLMMRFTRTLAALAEGRISRAHASVIMDAGSAIDDDADRAEFELAALDRAEIESAGRLRSIVQAIAEKVQPVPLTERHRAARRLRGVFVRDLEDAMAELVTVQPAVLVHGIFDRLTQMARADEAARDAGGMSTSQVDERRPDDPTSADRMPVDRMPVDRTLDDRSPSDRTPDGNALGDDTRDDRTLDQRRADILADILLAGAPVAAGEGLGSIRGRVQVTVPVLTLAGIHDGGADLAGHGPIDGETARRLAGGAKGWDRIMIHPVSGAVLAVDRYRPSADLERALRVRDEHCRFPGCRQPVSRCDVDHTHAAADGGETDIENLAHLCRRHHTLKHASAWRVRQLGGGTLEWTSPTGLTYIDIPTPTLRFVPDGDPPPF